MWLWYLFLEFKISNFSKLSIILNLKPWRCLFFISLVINIGWKNVVFIGLRVKTFMSTYSVWSMFHVCRRQAPIIRSLAIVNKRSHIHFCVAFKTQTRISILPDQERTESYISHSLLTPLSSNTVAITIP